MWGGFAFKVLREDFFQPKIPYPAKLLSVKHKHAKTCKFSPNCNFRWPCLTVGGWRVCSLCKHKTKTSENQQKREIMISAWNREPVGPPAEVKGLWEQFLQEHEMHRMPKTCTYWDEIYTTGQDLGTESLTWIRKTKQILKRAAHSIENKCWNNINNILCGLAINNSHKNEDVNGTSLVAQWLRLWVSAAGGPGSIPPIGELRSHSLRGVAKKIKFNLKKWRHWVSIQPRGRYNHIGRTGRGSRRRF